MIKAAERDRVLRAADKPAKTLNAVAHALSGGTPEI
jgi:hypothetical protein